MDSEFQLHAADAILHLQAQVTALRLLVGVCVTLSPAALEAAQKMAPMIDDMTLPLPLLEEQRNEIAATLLQVIEEAQKYHERIANLNK